MLLNRADIEEFKIDYPVMKINDVASKYRLIKRDINQLAKVLGIYKSKIGTGKAIKF